MKHLLQQLTKEELETIVLEFMEAVPELEQTFLLKFGRQDEAHLLMQFENLVWRAVQNQDEFWTLKASIEERLKKGQYVLSLKLIHLLVKHGVRQLPYEAANKFVYELVELIRRISLESFDFEIAVQEETFQWIVKIFESEGFEEWEDARGEVIGMGMYYMGNSSCRHAFMTLLEREIEKSKSEYRKKSAVLLLLNVCHQSNEVEKLRALLSLYGHQEFVMEWLAEQYIEAGQHERVVALTLEGEKISKNPLRWMRLRHGAYEEMNWIDEQKQLAYELVVEGDFDYYYRLKELYQEEFPTIYPRLKEALRQKSLWSYKPAYLQLLQAENDLAALLECVQEDSSFIERFAPLLVEVYPQDVLDVYTEEMLLRATRATTPAHYQRLCNDLLTYRQVIGERNTKRLVEHLKFIYKNRRAFLQELESLDRKI